MNRRIIFLLLAILALCVPTQAQWVAGQATSGFNDTWAPALASSPEGVTVLGYATSGDPLLMDFVNVMVFPTLATDNLVWPTPATLTSGNGIALCWSRTGFYAAVNSGGIVVLYHADDYGNWDPLDEIILSSNGYVTNMDLWGVPTDAAGPDVFLALETWSNPPTGNYHVQFASHSAFGWSALETVVTDLPTRPNPQVTWSIGPAGPWPTIFYLRGDSEESMLHSTTKDLAAGWQTPIVVPAPCPFGGDFDIVTTFQDDRHVLGMGMQPTCPCGTIHHQTYEAGTGWLPALNMTRYTSHYDWPMSPRIAAGNDGLVHAFWYQESAAYDFTPLRKTLEYRVLENDVWTDEGGFLNEPGQTGSVGSRVAITVDPDNVPVLAWTKRDTVEGVPQPEQIWVARLFDTTPVPDEPIPGRRPQLSARPNPFNPGTTVHYTVPHDGYVDLTVHDVSGRFVTRLVSGLHAQGQYEERWSGRDHEGRPAASGSYICRLVVGTEQATETLVLLK